MDLCPYFGVRAVAREVDGLRCDLCRGETIRGTEIAQLRNQLVALLLALPERLSKEMLYFLRLYLDYTQKELAERMGITRKTVAEWEGKGKISPQHDLILRTLAFARLSETTMLDHVRTAAPRSKRPPLVVPKIDKVA